MSASIDLTTAASGAIGDGLWFSDLYRSLVVSEFTGGVLVSSDGERAIFFEQGRPIHAAGAGYKRHFLGEVLMREGLVSQSQVSDAVQEQQSAQPRPLLGALLVSKAGIDPGEVNRAVRLQTEARLLNLFGVAEGSWKSAPGRDARVSEIGVACEPWPLFLAGLTAASDGELRAVSDALLGKAVSHALPRSTLDRLNLDASCEKLLRYMEKPRKPDQLERAMRNRRLVRALLRIIAMEDGLKVFPVAKAIPIPKATLLKGFGAAPRGDSGSGDKAKPREQSGPKEEPRVAPPRPKSLPPIAREVREYHKKMKKLSHFELFGVDKSKPVEASALRKTFTSLAKKFHPDAFPSELPEEIQTLAREVSAHLNDAYHTLSDEASRAEYLALLSDDRIKGDARKAELIRDAETKHQMGTVMLRKKDFQKAREFFKLAMENDPTTGKYKTNFVWAMFSDPDFERAKAIELGYPLILEALKASDASAQTHYVAGQLLKAQDRMSEAEHHFKIATKLDRKHAEAKTELRLIQMRAEKKKAKAQEKKGAFSRLFGKD